MNTVTHNVSGFFVCWLGTESDSCRKIKKLNLGNLCVKFGQQNIGQQNKLQYIHMPLLRETHHAVIHLTVLTFMFGDACMNVFGM